MDGGHGEVLGRELLDVGAAEQVRSGPASAGALLVAQLARCGQADYLAPVHPEEVGDLRRAQEWMRLNLGHAA